MSHKARYVEAMRGQAEVARNQGDDEGADRIDDIADAVEEDDQFSEGEAQQL